MDPEEILIDNKFKDEEGFKHYNQYKVLRKYGEGSVGKVKEVMDVNTDKHYAMKVVNKLLLSMRKEYVRKPNGKMGVKTAFDAVEKEISLLNDLDNEYIVKLHEILIDEEGEKLYLILDNCAKGEIMNWEAEKMTFTPWNGQDFFSEDEIRGIILDTLEGLEYLHSIGVMHRDIKPQNLLLTDENKWKIADFGVACKLEDPTNDTLKSTEGTYHFMPPEWWNFETKVFSGVKADIWALGVTLYALTYNKMPFWADNELELGNVIMKDDIDFNQDRDASLNLKNLIIKLLEKDPCKRPTIAELKENDPFLTKAD